MHKSTIAVAALLLSTVAEAKMITKPVEYKSGDVALEGYLAYDDAREGKRPGVLVVHEWWGLNDYAKKRANMLAEVGYVAFAVDMYGKGIVTDDPKRAGELMGAVRSKPVMRERIRAGYDVLAKQSNVDPKRIGAIGYCFGGMTCLELAYSGADVAGVVSFHGSVVPPGPEDAKRNKASILICHGAADPMVTRDMVQACEDGLERAGADWQLLVYAHAKHSFTNPESDRRNIPGLGYNEKADRRSWEHMKVFFTELFHEKK